MGPVQVVEILELAQGVQQVKLVPDQGAVQQFMAAGPYRTFHDRVHGGYSDTGEHGLHARVGQYGVEQASDLPSLSRIRYSALEPASCRNVRRGHCLPLVADLEERARSQGSQASR